MKLTKILICLLIFWTGTLSASPYFSFKKYQVEDGLWIYEIEVNK